MIIILKLKYCKILTRKLLQKLLQKKKMFIFLFVFMLFCVLPKKLKAWQNFVILLILLLFPGLSFFSDVFTPTLILIHLSLVSSLMNSIIHTCIAMISSCLNSSLHQDNLNFFLGWSVFYVLPSLFFLYCHILHFTMPLVVYSIFL